MSDLNKNHGTSASVNDLWCMHIEGPDDLHAAPDFWTALAWAAELNTFIAEKAIKGGWAADDNYPLSQATVRRWTGTAESHADNLSNELIDRQRHVAAQEAAGTRRVNNSLDSICCLIWELIREWHGSSNIPEALNRQLASLEKVWCIVAEDAGNSKPQAINDKSICAHAVGHECDNAEDHIAPASSN